MARAFQDTPGFSWVFPDPAERPHCLGCVFGWAAQGGHRFGEATVVGSPLEGIMVVYRLDAPVDAEQMERFDRSADQAMVRELGAVVYQRLSGDFNRRIFGAADQALRGHLNPDALYLDLLAVDPTSQGRGVGGLLVQYLNRRADQERRQCGLLTFEPRAVPFYQRHGYALVSENTDAPSGVHWWSLVRQPRTS
jgi:GNAT superfamily N-acetyltransferase